MIKITQEVKDKYDNDTVEWVENFAVKSSEATDDEINESNRLVANDRTDE